MQELTPDLRIERKTFEYGVIGILAVSGIALIVKWRAVPERVPSGIYWLCPLAR